jgi:hypothetical protein
MNTPAARTSAKDSMRIICTVSSTCENKCVVDARKSRIIEFYHGGYRTCSFVECCGIIHAKEANINQYFTGCKFSSIKLSPYLAECVGGSAIPARQERGAKQDQPLIETPHASQNCTLMLQPLHLRVAAGMGQLCKAKTPNVGDQLMSMTC